MSEEKEPIPFVYVFSAVILIVSTFILAFAFATVAIPLLNENHEEYNWRALWMADIETTARYDHIDFNYDIVNKTLYMDDINGGRIQIFADFDAIEYHAVMGFLPVTGFDYEHKGGDHIKLDNYKRMIIYNVTLNETTQINFWCNANLLEVKYYPENNTFVRPKESRNFC